MKKIILAALALNFLVAQADAQNKDKKDGVKMKNGKVWVVKDGNKTEATREVTLNDGSRVMTDGSVVMADGTVKKLGDGDMITMDGKWVDKNKMDKKDKKDKDDQKDNNNDKK